VSALRHPGLPSFDAQPRMTSTDSDKPDDAKQVCIERGTHSVIEALAMPGSPLGGRP